MKFKPGDEAVVTGDTRNMQHGFQPGTKVVTGRERPVHGTIVYYCRRTDGYMERWVNEVDLEPTPPSEEDVQQAIQSIQSIMAGAVTEAAREAVEPVPAVVYNVLSVENDADNGPLVEIRGTFKTLEGAQRHAKDTLADQGRVAPVWSAHEDVDHGEESGVVSMLVSQDYVYPDGLLYIVEQEVRE